MSRLLKMRSWKELEKYALKKQPYSQKSVLQNGYVSTEYIDIDYREQCINEQTLTLLFELAEECGLKEKIHELMTGYPVNNTENIPALHTALRSNDDTVLLVNGHNIITDIINVREKMYAISIKIRNGEWRGYSGECLTDIVNIGIGGSMLGPAFCISALSEFTSDKLKFHFISDVDLNTFKHVMRKLNPETTLFIVSSKSFTTTETLCNLKRALLWINQPKHINKHFIAVTSNIQKAKEFGITNILPIWNWVGGRFSLWSAINLITCIAIGPVKFSELLLGARLIDEHFRTMDFLNNAPVLLGLIGVWNINFLNINNLLVLTYLHNLQQFVPHLQQLDMESNGKSSDKEGFPVNYSTGPIIWGGSGNQAQHSYYQSLYQGTNKIAADVISVSTFNDELINKMCLAHKEVLSKRTFNCHDLHKDLPLGIPINHIYLADCTPQAIGSLIAVYEHKIFTQSVIWNINPFDQPGVESSKKILMQMAHKMEYHWE